MNDLEFREQYKRLKEVHPYAFDNNEKAQTVWRFVKDLDAPWFRSLVDRIVMSSRADKIDIGEAVAAEKRARNSTKFATDVVESLKLRDDVSNNGLEKVLEKYKLKSLSESLSHNRTPKDES